MAVAAGKAVWQLQEAKNRFSEMVDRARADGPQTVTRRGREAVVVVAVEEYRRLVEPRPSFKRFLARAPLADVSVDRARDRGRKIDL